MIVFISRLKILAALVLTFSALLSAQTISGRRELPRNLGFGLGNLIELHRARPAGMLHLDLKNKTVALNNTSGNPQLISSAKRGIVSDRLGRVLVTVILDPDVSQLRIRQTLQTLGATVVAEDSLQPNMLSAFVPLDSAATLAESAGISAVKLSRKAIRNIGAVTSQGVGIIHSDQVNAGGITGQGITIGIISDSFDAVSLKPRAADDVATADLPNIGVADGRPGLKFLSDGPGEDFGDTDEGRAMAQIAFDVAPGINLCFATADFGQVGFAKSIRRLRTDSSCAADIIVDDIQYEDEPMFSDGIVAKAVDDVVTSDSLAGRKVAYFSAAGNEAKGGYSSDLHFVPDTDARALLNSGIDTTSIPTRIDTSGGFHNFNPDVAGAPVLSQLITLTSSDVTTFILQWDDLFDSNPSSISTDLNLLVFNAKGRYLGSSSDDNFSTNEPIEIVDIPSGTYRLVIARTGRGSHLATRVRYVASPNASDYLTGDYVTSLQPAIYGHAASRNAQAVAAYNFDSQVTASRITPALEYYSSPGPIVIAFDNAGNRLSTPELRNKPDFAAPDNVSTTFFFYADTNDSFFAFPGTSAAGPHAAGAAALLLQAAGGPGSLTSEQIRAKLQASPEARDIDPFFSKAVLSSGGATATITATGDDSTSSSGSSSFFRVDFTTSAASQTLTGLTIDLGPAGLNFDPSTQSGFPLTVGSATSGLTITSTAPAARSAILTLTFSGFSTDGFLTFGIDRDLASSSTGGNNADLLAGAKVTATFSSGTPATGTFANTIGTGYSASDGFGLINVPAAIKAP